MNSPWHLPLPLGKYSTSRVVVYFHNGRWIPITFYPLIDAINLCRKASSSGMDIAVFPLGLEPGDSDMSILEAHYPTAQPPTSYSETPIETNSQYVLG
jgi:hypothetical protein